MKPSEYLFCPLWRKEALDIEDDEYQHTEQKHDLYHIIDKELQAAAELAVGIKTAGVQQ